MVVVMFIHAGNYHWLFRKKKKKKPTQSKEIMNFGKIPTCVASIQDLKPLVCVCLVHSTFRYWATMEEKSLLLWEDVFPSEGTFQPDESSS